jgi:putative ABC transport system permease protein
MNARITRLVPSLAVADLRHEWVLTLCLVIAVAAVVAPLLILQGLKHGTVATLRDRLVQDPVFREIRPSQTREYPPDWIERLAADPGVAFLLPTILPASSILGVVHPGTGRLQTLDLIPSGDGDPLILENGGKVPQDGELVLTAAAAAQIEVRAGDDLEVRATRSRGGVAEQGEARMRVAAVLDPRAGTLARVYAPLAFVLDLEAFKEGQAVPGRGWAGDVPRPQPSFDAVLVLLEAPLDAVARAGLTVNTGLATLDTLTAEATEGQLGWRPPAGWQVYRLAAPGGSLGAAGLEALRRKLRGLGALVLPQVDPAGAVLEGLPVQPIGLSLTAEQAKRLGIPPPPWGGYDAGSMEGSRLRQVWLPPELAGEAEAGRSLGLVARGMAEVSFPVKVAGAGPVPGRVYVPAELLGVLRTGQQRPLGFDGDAFTVARAGYRGFRLYARTIDAVPALVERLRTEGVDVVARADDIRRIQVLDQGLARLFWLVASLGVAGGVAVLVASLYAAVRRKRRELAILRLIGLTRLDVFCFPIDQGMALAGLGLALALGAYAALAAIINRAFAAELGLGQRICALPPATLLIASLAVLALATASSLLAAWQATRIDPAEAIREE